MLQVEQLERQYHALLARGVKDIPSWMETVADFDDHLTKAPPVLSPEQRKLRALGVL